MKKIKISGGDSYHSVALTFDDSDGSVNINQGLDWVCINLKQAKKLRKELKKMLRTLGDEGT